MKSVTITRKYMFCYNTKEITLHELTKAFYFQLSFKITHFHLTKLCLSYLLFCFPFLFIINLLWTCRRIWSRKCFACLYFTNSPNKLAKRVPCLKVRVTTECTWSMNYYEENTDAASLKWYNMTTDIWQHWTASIWHPAVFTFMLMEGRALFSKAMKVNI